MLCSSQVCSRIYPRGRGDTVLVSLCRSRSRFRTFKSPGCFSLFSRVASSLHPASSRCSLRQEKSEYPQPPFQPPRSVARGSGGGGGDSRFEGGGRRRIEAGSGWLLLSRRAEKSAHADRWRRGGGGGEPEWERGGGCFLECWRLHLRYGPALFKAQCWRKGLCGADGLSTLHTRSVGARPRPFRRLYVWSVSVRCVP